MFYKTFLLLRQLIFQCVFVPLNFIYGSIVILLTPFGRETQMIFVDSYARAALRTMKYILGIRYEISGMENIPKDETCIIWSKHQSLWECWLFEVYLPRQTWVFKKGLLKVPFFGWGLRAIRPIPIDRKAGRSAVQQVVEGGKERLKQGYWIVLFPEGTRMPVGKTRRFGKSGAILAVESGHKIFPIAHNSGEIWPRGSWLVYPGTVKVIFGEPVDPAGKTVDEITAQVKDWIESTMREISPVYVERAAVGLFMTAINSIFVVLATPFGDRVQYKFVRSWAFVCDYAMQIFTGITYEVIGKEKLPNEGTIVYMKHQSIWEIIILFRIVPQLVFVLKREAISVPIFGQAMKALKMIDIDRSSGKTAVNEIIEKGTDRLRQGLWLGIFPEGTRMEFGRTRRFGKSGVILAQAANAPLILMAHNGGEFWPAKSVKISSGHVKIVISDPVETQNRSIDSIVAECEEWMEKTMREISPNYAAKADHFALEEKNIKASHA